MADNTPQNLETKDILDIVPHKPVMEYQVEGFPLSSLEAFVLYANAAEIYSLLTNHKTIVGAINELWGILDAIDWDNYVTIDMLDDYVTWPAFNALKDDVTNLTLTVNNHTTLIGKLREDVDYLFTKLPPDPLIFVLSSNTNPRYFSAVAQTPHVNNYGFGITQEGDFVQSTTLADGILEILNLTFKDNVILRDFAGNEVDSNNTPHFYIPMTVDYFDSNSNYTGSDHFMLDGTWSREMGAYDFSIYFRGVVTIPENGRAHYKFSANVPVNTIAREETP